MQRLVECGPTTFNRIAGRDDLSGLREPEAETVGVVDDSRSQNYPKRAMPLESGTPGPHVS